ncbi:MAG: chaperone modulator CbpM [Marinirhabdus sp.]|nr:chaperone modulator CbpM [Marinirhabdus sp.]
MSTEQYIAITHLCQQYNVTEKLFSKFQETGLISVIEVEAKPCLHVEEVYKVEKIIRLNQELKVNPEGIDIILNLLEEIDQLHQKVQHLHQRLHLYSE